jgi:hypothetical protein
VFITHGIRGLPNALFDCLEVFQWGHKRILFPFKKWVYSPIDNVTREMRCRQILNQQMHCGVITGWRPLTRPILDLSQSQLHAFILRSVRLFIRKKLLPINDRAAYRMESQGGTLKKPQQAGHLLLYKICGGITSCPRLDGRGQARAG